MKNLIHLILLVGILVFSTSSAEAHRSGCHRWHSCPSDSGSYSCGDAGHPCQYPTYPASGGVVYPSSGYYKDCYDCQLKKVPTNDTRTLKTTLKKGDSGSSVTTLQKILKKEGFFEDEPSGYYGEITQKAVQEFQKKYLIVSSGTPSTTGFGNIGWATLSKLNELYPNGVGFFSNI